MTPTEDLRQLVYTFMDTAKRELPSIAERYFLEHVDEINNLTCHPYDFVFHVNPLGNLMDTEVDLWYDEKTNTFYVGIGRSSHPDADDIHDKVYRCVLRQLRHNLEADGKLVFYPATGFDWRIAEEWPRSRIVAIDTGDYKWSRPNVLRLQIPFDDVDRVDRELKRYDIEKADIIVMKGSDFLITSPYPPLPVDSTPIDLKSNFDKMMVRRLNNGGRILALTKHEGELCQDYLPDFHVSEGLPHEFSSIFTDWNKFLEQMEAKISKIGYWNGVNYTRIFRKP